MIFFDFEIIAVAFPISKITAKAIFDKSVLHIKKITPSNAEKKIIYDETYIEDSAADFIDVLNSKLCLEIFVVYE